MNGPYLESHELERLDELLEHAASDTIKCWISTRVNGRSASLSCDGNISMRLIKELDRLIMPIIKEHKEKIEELDRAGFTI